MTDCNLRIPLPRSSFLYYTKMVKDGNVVQLFDGEQLVTTVKFENKNQVECDLGKRLIRGEYDTKKKKWNFSENIWFHDNGRVFEASKYDRFNERGYRIMNSFNCSSSEFGQCVRFFNALRNFYLSDRKECNGVFSLRAYVKSGKISR